MKKYFLFLCALLLCGCSASWYARRDVKKLDGLSLQYPAEFAKLSNQLLPCFNGIAKSDTITVKGKPDTAYLAGDTTIALKNDTVIKTVYLTRTISMPYFITIHDTVVNNRALTSCDSAQQHLANLVIAQNTTINSLTATSKTKTYWIIGMGLLIAAGVGYKLYSLFQPQASGLSKLL